MLPAATDRILGLGDDALILDVGGWAAPFNRADWVIDAMPFATRGAMGFSYGGDRERFGEDTWVRRDVCERSPWPFAEDQFDLVMCVTTLEDLRDPVWVCEEMSRVGRAGYLEVPSVLNELTWRLPGEGFYLGNRHHHWFCWADGPGLIGSSAQPDRGPGHVAFAHKQHGVHSDPDLRVTAAMAAELRWEEQVQGLFWDGEVLASERLLIGETLHAALAASVAARFPPSGAERVVRAARRRAAGRRGQALDPLRRALDRGLRRARGGRVAPVQDVEDQHVRLGLGRPRDGP